MKHNKLILWLLLGLTVLILGACGSSSQGETIQEGPDDIPIQLEPAGQVISRYSLDEKDYSALPLEDTKILRLHYRRNDDHANDRSSYEPWNVWAWDMGNGGNGAAYPFTGYDDYGVYADLDLAVISGGKSLSRLGFIVRTDNWSKDPDGDRFVDILPQTPGGLQEVFVRTMESTVFDTRDNALKSIVSYAMLQSTRAIEVYFKPLSGDFSAYAPRFSLRINGEEYKDFTMGEYDPFLKRVPLTLKESLDVCDQISVGYRFDNEWTCRVDVMLTNYYDTEEFNALYAYEGRDLGVSFDQEASPTATSFKVWAPTSSAMVLKLYQSGDPDSDPDPLETHEMTKGEKGVFAITLPRDLTGYYYTYTVTNAKGTHEVVDPYARGAGVNGRRGLVVNFTRLNQSISGWEQDNNPFTGRSVDAVIYEAHVRDMTISPSSGVPEAYRGRFLGLAQGGTYYEETIEDEASGETQTCRVSTGLDHLVELGITHVQLQPIFDYASVDEAASGTQPSRGNYNWGYDPLNYNLPEGSYATDPYDGTVRIRELKEMILALHRAGIGVNMDVVYNHTAASENSNLNLLVPYYYYRTKANGSFYNGSGCGNEIATERYMVNKFIRESCLFWAEEYHISGFRFDLMGLMDNQIMADIYKDLTALDPHFMVYGEPWTGGSSKLKAGISDARLKEQTTVQESLAQDYFGGSGILVGAFNDVLRNAARGDNNPGKGYVQGSSADASQLALCLEGRFSKGSIKTQNIDPNQVLNYVSCHDNYTLYDQLIQTLNEERLPAAYTQAEALVFLSQGIPFIQEGEEFLRSKYNDGAGKTRPYDGNSYQSGDLVNLMDYSLKIKNRDIYEKIRELIALRRATALLRLLDRSAIAEQLRDIRVEQGTISFRLGDLWIFHTISGGTVTLPGDYEILYSSSLERDYGPVSGEILLLGNESLVLRER